MGGCGDKMGVGLDCYRKRERGKHGTKMVSDIRRIGIV